MPRKLLAGLLVMVAAMLSSGCSGSAQAAIIGYRSDLTGLQLVLVAETGPKDTIVGAHVLAQDDQSVTVEVLMRQYTNIQPAVAVSHEIMVMIARPLGDRKVRGPRGNIIPHLVPVAQGARPSGFVR